MTLESRTATHVRIPLVEPQNPQSQQAAHQAYHYGRRLSGGGTGLGAWKWVRKAFGITPTGVFWLQAGSRVLMETWVSTWGGSGGWWAERSLLLPPTWPCNSEQLTFTSGCLHYSIWRMGAQGG